MGVADKGYQQGQKSFGGWKESTSNWYNPFSWGREASGWGVNPEAFQYQMGIPQGWNQGANQMSQMQAGNDVRAQQVAMMNLLAQRAQGQNLASAAMAQQQLQQGQGAIASKAAAAQRGGYDPATARDALYATGALGGQVAGNAAIAAAQEQMAAAQAMGQMGQGVRGTDVQQMIQAQQLANQLRGMGMQDKAMDLQARMAYEQAQMNAYLGNQEGGSVGGLLGYGLGALAGGFASGWSPQGIQMGGQMGQSVGNYAGSK